MKSFILAALLAAILSFTIGFTKATAAAKERSNDEIGEASYSILGKAINTINYRLHVYFETRYLSTQSDPADTKQEEELFDKLATEVLFFLKTFLTLPPLEGGVAKAQFSRMRLANKLTILAPQDDANGGQKLNPTVFDLAKPLPQDLVQAIESIWSGEKGINKNSTLWGIRRVGGGKPKDIFFRERYLSLTRAMVEIANGAEISDPNMKAAYDNAYNPYLREREDRGQLYELSRPWGLSAVEHLVETLRLRHQLALTVRNDYTSSYFLDHQTDNDPIIKKDQSGEYALPSWYQALDQSRARDFLKAPEARPVANELFKLEMDLFFLAQVQMTVDEIASPMVSVQRSRQLPKIASLVALLGPNTQAFRSAYAPEKLTNVEIFVNQVAVPLLARYRDEIFKANEKNSDTVTQTYKIFADDILSYSMVRLDEFVKAISASVKRSDDLKETQLRAFSKVLELISSLFYMTQETSSPAKQEALQKMAALLNQSELLQDIFYHESHDKSALYMALRANNLMPALPEGIKRRLLTSVFDNADQPTAVQRLGHWREASNLTFLLNSTNGLSDSHLKLLAKVGKNQLKPEQLKVVTDEIAKRGCAGLL